jgi:hypothetical protein
MTDRFGPADLALLRDAQEVSIETRATADAPVHRTVIWVVVGADDRVLIRTYLGPGSRWYREALAEPDCRLRVGDRELHVRAVPAADDASIAAYNEELLRKYARSRSTPFMLADALLPTTLELLLR